MKTIIFILNILIAIQLSSQEFQLDPGHTFIQFSIERFGAVHVAGRFNSFSGSVSYDPVDEIITNANILIDVESIDTGHETRDGHLTGEQWLNANEFPDISFQAESFSTSSDGFLAKGELTIHGITQKVEIPFQMNGPMVDPTKTNAIGISAMIDINRQDYGISFSRVLDNGKLFIGNEVIIRINALAVMK